MLKINDFVKEVGENAIAHGWWDGEERSFGELIALCHSELSEALEEYRTGHAPDKSYYSGAAGALLSDIPHETCYKLEGIPSELADVIIRICDICHHYGIDLDAALIEKHEYNKSRPYRHGGKVI